MNRYLAQNSAQNANLIPAKELDTCRHMVRRNIPKTTNEKRFEYTHEEAHLIAASCEDEDIAANLTALGYGENCKY